MVLGCATACAHLPWRAWECCCRRYLPKTCIISGACVTRQPTSQTSSGGRSILKITRPRPKRSRKHFLEIKNIKNMESKLVVEGLAGKKLLKGSIKVGGA